MEILHDGNFTSPLHLDLCNSQEFLASTGACARKGPCDLDHLTLTMKKIYLTAFVLFLFTGALRATQASSLKSVKTIFQGV